MGWILLLFCFLFQEVQADRKIFCATIPKSGTHLLKSALELMLEVPAEWIDMPPLADPSLEAKLKASEHRVYFTHLFSMTDTVRSFNPNDFAKILLIRDPRDVMISFVHHLIEERTWAYCAQFSHERFIKLAFAEQLKEAILYPRVNPLYTLSYAAAWMKDPTVLVCRFEDLVGEKGGGSKALQIETLLKIASHIGHPLTHEKAEEIAGKLFGMSWTFRKGQAGEWKNHYSEENKALFKRLAKSAIQDLGYGKQDW